MYTFMYTLKCVCIRKQQTFKAIHRPTKKRCTVTDPNESQYSPTRPDLRNDCADSGRIHTDLQLRVNLGRKGHPESEKVNQRDSPLTVKMSSTPTVLTEKVISISPLTVRKFRTRVFDFVAVKEVYNNQFRSCLE